MDPPPLPPPTAATAAVVEPPYSHSLPPLPTSKLRLMCSYGGHIVPRPQTKSLCYAGGETRIVAVDRRTTASTISSLTQHLSRTLFGNRPFTLKYQLPNEDLDSLISITTDEDLHNMLEEHDRIASSSTHSRIRMFLFPTRPESVGSLLLDPKSESWFSDALKSTMIINRGLSDGAGMDNGLMSMGLDCLEGNGESLVNSGDGKGGGDSGSVPESMVLETCSSFGSTNSSISMSNLPPIGGHSEDGEKKTKVAAPGSVESDNSSASAPPYQKTGIYQDQMLHATAQGTNVSSNALESESIIYNPSATIQTQRILQVSGYQIPNIPDQKQQPVQYVHTGPHYIQHYSTGPLPMSSYYPMYVPYQQPNQPYPVYVMPVGPAAQSYNVSAPSDRTGSLAGSLSRPPLPTHMVNPRVAYKEVMVSQQTPELAAESYRMNPPQATPFDGVSSHQNQQQHSGLPEMHRSSKPVGPTLAANPTFENEYDNDLAYAQIYKSQPSAPAFPPPTYETMTKAATVLLSDSSAQLQVGTSQPQ